MAPPQTETADTNGSNGSLLTASLKHIEDIRSLSVCKICMRSLYEPFILSCGHTYCYTCLASWFGGSLRRRSKKNCPDCRARITAQPSPNYILRDLVHMLIGRAELLPEDETLQEHQLAKEEEAAQVAADRTGPGLFKGIFVRPTRGQLRWGQGILDPEDNVLRCPECHWELEDGECPHCGFHEMYDSNGPLESDFDSDSATDLELDTMEDTWGFGAAPRRRYGLNLHQHEISPALSETDEEDDYGEEDDLDDFIDNSAEEDNDDTNSESTMTMYNRQWAENTRYHNASDAESQASADSGHDHFDRYGDYVHRLRNEHWGISDAETNYDEMTEASEHETASPPADSERPRASRAMARRRVVSDDDDDEGEEEEGQEEDRDEEPEDQDEDDETFPSQHSETEGDQSHSESDESDVRPPQPSSRRRQHLQTQRARRNDSNHQSHMEGAQRRNSPVRQQYRHRQRSNIPRNSTSGRRTGYQQPFERPGFGPRIPVGGMTGYSL